jgi:phosphoglycolate phosphatase
MDCKYKLMLFDFDYTLADSSKGAISCINYALEKMGLAKVSDEEACRTIGLSLSNTFLKLCNENGVDKVKEFSKLFIKHADEVMADCTEIYGSVPETIKTLKANGLKLGIVSGKFRYRIEEILRRAGLQNAFDFIIGGEDVVFQKPNSEGVMKVLRLLDLKPEELLYIGDSLTDAETAENAGVTFIATLTGMTKKEEFSNFNVYKYINEISELIDLVFNEKIEIAI